MKERPLSLLVVDDDPVMRRIFTGAVVARESVEVCEAADGEEALEVLRLRPVDLAFVDIRMPRMGGMDLLKKVKESHPELEVVIITAHATVESAVQAMKLGAADYLCKPFPLDQVSLILARFRRMRVLKSENAHLRKEIQERAGTRNLIGNAPSMERCHHLIDRVRGDDSNVLILGESGTGKELIARAIHSEGTRKDRLFVPIDCGAIQPSLLESELFGHEKGAFTGAHVRKVGLFEFASGGTVFLDEIAEIPLELQPVLLRAIEEKKVRPVGATDYRSVNVRVIAATNRPLEEMVARGQFRRDLFYRLNVITIKIPPLRERREDIPLLVSHFIRRHGGQEPHKISGATREALEVLQRYDWPGNVRELEHAIQHACALGSGERIEGADLPPTVQEAVRSGIRPAVGAMSLRQMELEAIQKMLRLHEGDTARVATILEIDRSTLYRKIKRYGLALPRSKP